MKNLAAAEQVAAKRLAEAERLKESERVAESERLAKVSQVEVPAAPQLDEPLVVPSETASIVEDAPEVVIPAADAPVQ